MNFNTPPFAIIYSDDDYPLCAFCRQPVHGMTCCKEADIVSTLRPGEYVIVQGMKFQKPALPQPEASDTQPETAATSDGTSDADNMVTDGTSDVEDSVEARKELNTPHDAEIFHDASSKTRKDRDSSTQDESKEGNPCTYDTVMHETDTPEDEEATTPTERMDIASMDAQIHVDRQQDACTEIGQQSSNSTHEMEDANVFYVQLRGFIDEIFEGTYPGPCVDGAQNILFDHDHDHDGREDSASECAREHVHQDQVFSKTSTSDTDVDVDMTKHQVPQAENAVVADVVENAVVADVVENAVVADVVENADVADVVENAVVADVVEDVVESTISVMGAVAVADDGRVTDDQDDDIEMEAEEAAAEKLFSRMMEECESVLRVSTYRTVQGMCRVMSEVCGEKVKAKGKTVELKASIQRHLHKLDETQLQHFCQLLKEKSLWIAHM